MFTYLPDSFSTLNDFNAFMQLFQWQIRSNGYNLEKQNVCSYMTIFYRIGCFRAFLMYCQSSLI